NQRGKPPGIIDAMRLEPGLHGVLAVGAGEFVLVIRGLQRGANFIFALGEQSAVFRAKRGVAVRRAEAFEAIVQSRSGAARGCRRIVQLVREASRQFTEGRQFFPLLLLSGDISNAVGEQSHQALRKLRHALKQFGELAGGKRERAHGEDSAHGHGESLHAGERQHAGNVAHAGGVDRAVGGAALAASPQFPFEYDEHDVSRSAFRHRGFAHGGAPLFALRDKPFEIVPGLIRERQDFSQIRHQGFDSRLIHHAAHWTFARYWCMNCTTTAPSPTPEATRLTEPWRTSPTTKIPGTLVSSNPGSRSSVHDGGLFPPRRRSGPERMNPRSSRSIKPPSHSVRGCAPMKMYRLVAGTFSFSPVSERRMVSPVSRDSP